jgi:hypothetical protein
MSLMPEKLSQKTLVLELRLRVRYTNSVQPTL